MKARVLEDGTVQAGLRMPADLGEWCTKEAKARGLTRNGWVVALINREKERIEKEGNHERATGVSE